MILDALTNSEIYK